MHTICRFFVSLWAAIGLCIPFALIGAIPALAGDPALLIVLLGTCVIFFAPAAFINKWDDFGD